MNDIMKKGQRLGCWVLEEIIATIRDQCDIWSARHFITNSKCAIKVKNYEEMTEEIRFLLYCHHEDISLPIFEVETRFQGDKFGTYKDKGWIAMKQYSTDLSKLSTSTAMKYWKSILLQCIEQLYSIHRMHTIHGDLKDQNILVSIDDKTNTCHAAITDFGLSDNVYTLIKSGRPQEDHKYYMMCAGMYPYKTFSSRCDYEALGIAIGFCITGVSYRSHFERSGKTVVDQRKWENLKESIPECMYPYFKFLEEMSWEDTRMSYVLKTNIIDWIKTD